MLTGKSVSELFEESGEEGFRRWETTVIQAISLKGNQVISLGGGAPTVAENRRLIKKVRSGRIVDRRSGNHLAADPGR